MIQFNDHDRFQVAQLEFDPNAEPSFELLKSCLVWPDERPERVSAEGYESLCDLWIVRGYIHRGVHPENWKLDPAYFQLTWCSALVDVPGWPGFRRLQLSSADREYLFRSLKEAADGEGA